LQFGGSFDEQDGTFVRWIGCCLSWWWWCLLYLLHCTNHHLTSFTPPQNRYVQPCALCSACRDWNAGEFCPWDLTGIIGDVSSDDSIGTCSATAASNPNLAGFESSVASEEFDAVAANASSLEEAGENVKASADMGSSHPSTASFVGAGGVPQEIGDFISEVDMTWD
jgi:hypothetical protein